MLKQPAKYGKQGYRLRFAMPIYEYRCQRCGSEFELLQASIDRAACCPECGSARLKKRFSLFAVSGSARQPGQGTSASCAGCRSRRCATCR
jgi:putative FmdB family regulatory protein